MPWWQLSLIGIGCTIGTGFFLGSSMAIKKSGPAVSIPFLLAAIGTYIVYNALVKMSVDQPDKGSFRSYAKLTFGRWAGFSNGWVYLLSEMLIMGSQLMALGIFTQFWFPALPLWIGTTIYAVLGLLIILTGLKGFEKFQNVFGFMKIAAIVMFIIIAIVMLYRSFHGEMSDVNDMLDNYSGFFSEGYKGIWLALLYAFYAFGGIEVIGLLVIDMKNPKEAPKAGKIMIFVLTFIYVVSLSLAVALISWKTLKVEQSPFITALEKFDLPFVTDIFNGILIIAGFSTMVASLYAVMTILVALAEDQDAPAFLAKKGKLKVPIPAFLFIAGGLALVIFIGFMLPEKIFEYMITAAGLMLLYNWSFILVTYLKRMSPSRWEQVMTYLGLLLIGITVSGTLGEKTSRIGFYVSILFVIIIGIATIIKIKKWGNASSNVKD